MRGRSRKWFHDQHQQVKTPEIEYYGLRNLPSLSPAQTVYSAPIFFDGWNRDFPPGLFAGILHRALNVQETVCVVAQIAPAQNQPRSNSAFFITLSRQEYYDRVLSPDFPRIRCLGRAHQQSYDWKSGLFVIARTPEAKASLEGMSCVIGPRQPLRFEAAPTEFTPCLFVRRDRWRWEPYNNNTAIIQTSVFVPAPESVVAADLTPGRQW